MVPSLLDTSKILRLGATAALASGAANFGVVPSSRTYNSPAFPHAEISLDQPAPITMLVSCTTMAADTLNGPVDASSFIGSPTTNPQNASPFGRGLAGIRLVYGAGPAKRTVVMDARSGAYQLPVGTFAQSSIIAYRDQDNSFGAPGFSTRDIAIAFLPGFVHPTPTRPTVSMGFTNGAGGGALGMDVFVPAQARWFDMWAEARNVAPGGATSAQLLLNSGGGGNDASVLLYRDYVNQAFTPPWGPVEWAGPPQGNGLQFAQINAAALANQYYWCRFWLEL